MQWKKVIALKWIIADDVRAEENNRKVNEGIGIGNSAQIYDEHKI